MQHGRLRAVLRVLYAFFLIFTGFFVLTSALNRRYGKSWRTLYANALSGFRDRPGLLEDYLGAFSRWASFLLLAAAVLFLARWVCRKTGISCTLRVRIGRLRFSLGGPEGARTAFRLRLAAALLAAALCALCGLDVWRDFTRRQSLWPGDALVGHAFGAIDGVTYTNSREAFEYHYAEGLRTFEVDMILSQDRHLILAHEYESADFREFIGGGALGWATVDGETMTVSTPYTTMDVRDLLQLMKDHPDVWIVTDTKYASQPNIGIEFQAIVDAAMELDAVEALDRMVIQLYNEDMLQIVENIWPFKSYIFTQYQRWNGLPDREFIDICRWSSLNGVNALCMWDYLYTDEVRDITKRYGLDVYVHTVNDPSAARDALERGARGVYTDVLNHPDVVI